MKFTFGLRAMLFVAMVGLALFVVAIAVATSTGLAVRDTVNTSVVRARAYANEAARLAARAASATPASNAADSIAGAARYDSVPVSASCLRTTR